MNWDLAEALPRLEGLLARSGAAIVPVLHPGIGELEVVRLLDDVGLAPTAEVAAWFGWHDGAGGPGMSSRVIEVVPGGEFYDLAYLCRECAETRNNSEAVAATPGGVLTADDLWRPSWFPLLRLFGKGFVVVDLAGGEGSVSPVHVVWHGDSLERRARVAWRSIAAFVEAMIGRFEDGTYAVDDGGVVQGPTIDVPD